MIKQLPLPTSKRKVFFYRFTPKHNNPTMTSKFYCTECFNFSIHPKIINKYSYTMTRRFGRPCELCGEFEFAFTIHGYYIHKTTRITTSHNYMYANTLQDAIKLAKTLKNTFGYKYSVYISYRDKQPIEVSKWMDML